MTVDELNAMGGAVFVFSKLIQDPQKLNIIEKLSRLDVDTLLKIEKIIDVMKEERQS